MYKATVYDTPLDSEIGKIYTLARFAQEFGWSRKEILKLTDFEVAELFGVLDAQGKVRERQAKAQQRQAKRRR